MVHDVDRVLDALDALVRDILQVQVLVCLNQQIQSNGHGDPSVETSFQTASRLHNVHAPVHMHMHYQDNKHQ